MEPTDDFVANNVVGNDILNPLLISGTQMPPTDDKYYSNTQASESEFSAVNVPDPTEDKVLQNDLSLPSESVVNVETSSANLALPAVTFGHNSLVDNSQNCHFQVQGNTFNELTAVPTISIPHSAQQLDGNVGCSPTILCPELDSDSRSTSGISPSLIVITNKETISPLPSIGYCSVGDSKTSFLI